MRVRRGDDPAPRDRGKTVRPLFSRQSPIGTGSFSKKKVPVLGEDVQVDDLVGGRFGLIDLVVILDTNSYSQLPRFEDFLKRAKPPILVVDHHVTSDQLGRVEITDTTAAAAGLVLFEFLRRAAGRSQRKPPRRCSWRLRRTPGGSTFATRTDAYSIVAPS